MEPGEELATVLASQTSGDATGMAVARAAREMASAAKVLARLIERPPLDGRLGAHQGGANRDGDKQRRLDLVAEDLFSRALRKAGVAAYLSEEVEEPGILNETGVLAVAIDPLDGSSNIDVNAPIGTIFSILPMPPAALAEPALAFRQPGRAQVAAGFFIYGPQTSLVVTFGAGTLLFVLDVQRDAFLLVDPSLQIPRGYAEYAINASNRRHWREPVKAYIADCEKGADGPRGRNFNMRWVGSMVADSYRIFTRGGIFLYPADARAGYQEGRLRLLYEANPVAFLAEQAGGAATVGIDPILDRAPHAPLERAPFFMGSIDEIDRVRNYHLETASPSRAAP